MMPPLDAQVHRRRLRGELRRAREKAGLTQRDVAEAMEWSLSKLIRIESGSVGISTTDLRVLLQHYGITDPKEVDRFLGLARAGREQTGWWTAYREVTSPTYQSFLGYETSASVIQTFQPLLVPGLLQDEEYARAVLSAYGIPDKQVDELVALRMQRQAELRKRPDPPVLRFVIDEAVLRRPVGGPAVMRHQLERLKEEGSRSNVTIDVIPFAAGAHPGLRGPFVILQFADERDEDLLFLETSRGDTIIRDDQEEVARYQEVFDQLRDLARTDDLEALIDRALGQMA